MFIQTNLKDIRLMAEKELGYPLTFHENRQIIRHCRQLIDDTIDADGPAIITELSTGKQHDGYEEMPDTKVGLAVDTRGPEVAAHLSSSVPLSPGQVKHLLREMMDRAEELSRHTGHKEERNNE